MPQAEIQTATYLQGSRENTTAGNCITSVLLFSKLAKNNFLLHIGKKTKTKQNKTNST